MQSYIYWADRHINPLPDDIWKPTFPVPYEFPYPLDRFLKDGETCPICDGWQQLEDRHYCLCSTLRWIEKQGEGFRDYEYPIIPTTLDAMIPMKSSNTQKQAAYDKMWADLQPLIEYVKAWIDKPTTWIAMFGDNGVGKSLVLRAIKTAIPNMAFYISVSDFQSRVFSGLQDNSYQEFLEFISTVPILLLDDWGIEHTTSMSTDALAAVIDRRYLNSPEFPTVITSNNLGVFDSPDIAIKRIASRIGDRQICKRFHIRSADFRLPDAMRKF